MNTSYVSDLLPYFCYSGHRSRNAESTFQAIRDACALNQTDKSLYATTSKDYFWAELLMRIGKENLLLDTRPNSGYYTLIKHQFKALNDWVKNEPLLTQDVVNASSIISHPFKCKSQLKVISLFTDIKIQTLLKPGIDEEMTLPDSNLTPFFTPESKKFYTCVSNSENFIAINTDDFNVTIYKNEEYLSTFPFEGAIRQIVIRNDYLYMRGLDQNGHKFTILNLNALDSTPKEILIPLELDAQSIANAWFGQTHIVLTRTEKFFTTLIAASYENLLNSPEDIPWAEKMGSGHFMLFEESNHFISVSFNLDKTINIAEIHLSNGDMTYQVIEEGLSLLQPLTGLYQQMNYFHGRLFVAFSENGMQRICTYDIETKKLSYFDLSEGPAFYSLLPLPYFMSTTPLKIYYLTFPVEDGIHNIQKISIFGFNYEQNKSLNASNPHL